MATTNVTSLDVETDSLSLLSILRAFDGPINEERAWAVLYQAAKTAHAQLQSLAPAPAAMAVVAEAARLWIHRDGHVHASSFAISSPLSQGHSSSLKNLKKKKKKKKNDKNN